MPKSSKKSTDNVSTELDWSSVAFGNKKPLSRLQATFIVAPRDLSQKRFTEIVQKTLTSGNIVIGIAKEDYIQGFEDQPHFQTLKLKTIDSIIKKVNAAKLPYKIYTLRYFQHELKYIVSEVDFSRVILINGSWQYAFHYLEPYYALAQKRIPISFLSPFIDDTQAMSTALKMQSEVDAAYPLPDVGTTFSETELMELVAHIAKRSFDYTFQTGAVLAGRSSKHYSFIAAAHNIVVPYETYAMHNGSQRESHFSPSQDLNHSDTVHAEVALLIKNVKHLESKHPLSLFINLLPCPSCARMISISNISEVVYQHDHSAGYGYDMLKKAGINVRRLV